MKYTVEIPDGPQCSAACPFFIEETSEYQQYCTLVKKAFRGKKKLDACPTKHQKDDIRKSLSVSV